MISIDVEMKRERGREMEYGTVSDECGCDHRNIY